MKRGKPTVRVDGTDHAIAAALQPRRTLLSAGLGVLASTMLPTQHVIAQDAAGFPSRPVRLVVPFPPGGATDIIGRLLGKKMSEVWGQPVLIDNRAGGGTTIGTDVVAKAAPDGYTVGVAITAHVINPSLRQNMPFDTVRDLAGVTQFGQAHLVLAAHPSFEANTMPELIAYAKRNPGKLAYASPGSGTAMHLAMELLKVQAGIDIQHIPYKGGAPAVQDVIGGRVPLFTDVLYSAMPHIKAGRLKVLALMSATRPASAAEYPLITETVPGVVATSMMGLVVPAGTPRALVRKMSDDVARAIREPDLAARLAELGMEPVGSKPEEYDAAIRSEIEKWARVVRISGATAD